LTAFDLPHCCRQGCTGHLQHLLAPSGRLLLLLQGSAGSCFCLQLLPCRPLGVCQLQLLLVAPLLLLQEVCELLVELPTPVKQHRRDQHPSDMCAY
jgi:hypothetical protein